MDGEQRVWTVIGLAICLAVAVLIFGVVLHCKWQGEQTTARQIAKIHACRTDTCVVSVGK